MKSNSIFYDKEFLIKFIEKYEYILTRNNELHHKNSTYVKKHVKQKIENHNEQKNKLNFFQRLNFDPVYESFLFSFKDITHYNYIKFAYKRAHNFDFYDRYIKLVIYISECEHKLKNLNAFCNSIKSLSRIEKELGGNFYYEVTQGSYIDDWIKNPEFTICDLISTPNVYDFESIVLDEPIQT